MATERRTPAFVLLIAAAVFLVSCGGGDPANNGNRLSTLDSDRDGLTDVQEGSCGSSPLSVDTDGDGLDDLRECTVLHTDPAEADTDGDGISDGDEIADGTDPLDPARVDFDRDGVPAPEDCNDRNATIKPGNLDPLDNMDWNCVLDKPDCEWNGPSETVQLHVEKANDYMMVSTLTVTKEDGSTFPFAAGIFGPTHMDIGDPLWSDAGIFVDHGQMETPLFTMYIRPFVPLPGDPDPLVIILCGD